MILVTMINYNDNGDMIVTINSDTVVTIMIIVMFTGMIMSN